MNIFVHLWKMPALLLLIHQVVTKKDKALFCSICRALVDEVSERIGDVDPNEKILSGSFRVDPQGNQKLVKKQYARSDVHLSEILENICEAFEDYALTQSPNRKLGVQRIVDRKTKKELDTKNVGFNPNLRATFKSYCHSMVEDYEDEMLRIFKQENLQAIEAELCGDLAEACTEDDLKRPVSKLEKKKEQNHNSFHQLEPKDEEEDVEEVEADDDLDKNIVKKSEKKGKKTKVEL